MTGSAFKRWTLCGRTESKGRGGLGERGARDSLGSRVSGFIVRRACTCISVGFCDPNGIKNNMCFEELPR